jgi:hypothetical protein
MGRRAWALPAPNHLKNLWQVQVGVVEEGEEEQDPRQWPEHQDAHGIYQIC